MLAWFGGMPKVPRAFFVTHGEIDASMALADSLGRNLGTATYIPHFGDCVEISGNNWQIHESDVVTAEPAALELRAYLKSVENDYLRSSVQKSSRLWLAMVSRLYRFARRSRSRKYMYEMFKDL